MGGRDGGFQLRDDAAVEVQELQGEELGAGGAHPHSVVRGMPGNAAPAATNRSTKPAVLAHRAGPPRLGALAPQWGGQAPSDSAATAADTGGVRGRCPATVRLPRRSQRIAGGEDGDGSATSRMERSLTVLELGVLHNGASDLPTVMTPDGVVVADGTLDEMHESDQRVIVNQVRQGVLADQLGFNYFFMTEHHFQPEGVELSPSPILMETAIAARTNRIRLGQLANILSWWHPIRIAPIGAPLRVLDQFVADVVFSPDGSILATLGFDGSVRLWDPITRELLHDLGIVGRNVGQMAFSPDGAFLVVPGIDGVFLWDVAAAKRADPFAVKISGPPSNIAFAADGRMFINVAGTIGAWDLSGSGLIARVLPGVSGSASLSRDGRRVTALGSGVSAPLSVWDAATGDLLIGPIATSPLPSQGLPPLQSADGTLAVTGHTDCLGPEGSAPAVIDFDCEDAILLWGMADGGTLVGEIRQGGQFEPGSRRYFPTALALSRDGTLLAVGRSDLTVVVYDTRSLEIVAGPLEALVSDGVGVLDALAIGELDGQPWLAALRVQSTEGDHEVAIWALPSQGPALLGTVPGPASGGLAFAPDGTLAVGSVGTGQVEIYDPRTRDVIRTLPGRDAARSLTFSADGRRMVVGSGYGAGDGGIPAPLQIWDFEKAASIGQPFGRAVHLSLSGAGDLLTTGGGPTVLWNLDPDVWETQACQAAGRNLTPAEWEEFLPPGEPYRATCEQWPAAGAQEAAG